MRQLDSQSFWRCEGLHVVGCATDSGIYNGQLYTVVAENSVGLQVYTAEEELGLNMRHIRKRQADPHNYVLQLPLANVKRPRPALHKTQPDDHHAPDRWPLTRDMSNSN